MRFKFQALITALVAVSMLVVVPAGAEDSASSSIKTTEVSFTVQNVNRSKLACPSDGGTYHVVGTLVTPAAVPKSVTLWIHNSIGDRNTFMVPIRNYHFANEMAKLGHASLAIDQLGYGKSDKPANGHLVCPGSEADVMYQVMEHLRTGDYEGDTHPSFEKVAVGGFSIGAWQAELIGVSFPHVDGIIPIGGMSAFVSSEAAPDVANSMSRECSTGSYFHFASAERRNYWAIYEPNVDKDVEDWWTRNSYGSDPCGIWENIMASTVTVDAVGPTANPDLKVLVVIGDKDRILPPPNGHFQVARFFNSHDVSLLTMPDTGHAVMLERNAPMFRQQLHLWMVQRGL